MIRLLMILTLSLQAEAGTVSQLCSFSPEKSELSRLSAALEELESRFAGTRARTNNPRGYIRALDKVIRATSFSRLLGCRDHLRDTFRIVYRINYQHRGTADHM